MKLPRNFFKPLAIGGKLYAIGLPDSRTRDGFAPVFDLDGRPLVFDMGVLAQRRLSAGAELTPAQRKRSEFRAGQAERIRQARQEGELGAIMAGEGEPQE